MSAELEPTDYSDVAPSNQFFSVGWLCEYFATSPREIRTMMKAAEVKFARSENETLFVDGHGLLALIEHRRVIRERVASFRGGK